MKTDFERVSEWANQKFSHPWALAAWVALTFLWLVLPLMHDLPEMWGQLFDAWQVLLTLLLLAAQFRDTLAIHAKLDRIGDRLRADNVRDADKQGQPDLQEEVPD